MTKSSTTDSEKQALRAALTARRKGISASTRDNGASLIASIGLGFIPAPAHSVISGYHALAHELNPLPLMESLERQGHQLALPVVEAKGAALNFRCWSPGDPLEPAAFGLRQPLISAGEVSPDILLVPLLAFDHAGNRLGFGAGFYDRTLAELRESKIITAVGIAFDEQEVEKVPHDGYDQKLDWVLTPSGPRQIESD